MARIIGPSGDAWLVGTSNVDRKRNRRVVRVGADGTVVDVPTNIDTSTVTLSADGSTLAWQRFVDQGRRVITYAALAGDGTVLGTKGPAATSCRDRVAAISPDGEEMLTFHILADGLGPGEIHQREVDGTRLATYITGWFSGWEWESPTTLLLDVNGRRKFATVRCDLDACENVTDPATVTAA